eukprot:3940746-Rhodomonas_salina.2
MREFGLFRFFALGEEKIGGVENLSSLLAIVLKRFGYEPQLVGAYAHISTGASMKIRSTVYAEVCKDLVPPYATSVLVVPTMDAASVQWHTAASVPLAVSVPGNQYDARRQIANSTATPRTAELPFTPGSRIANLSNRLCIAA